MKGGLGAEEEGLGLEQQVGLSACSESRESVTQK